jgi:transcriptional regulator with XRE-family HTH domain
MSFGNYIQNLRIKSKKTLRLFCAENGLNPSFWSKIERDVNPPPKDEAVLSQWAKYFGVKPNTDEWNQFMDEASISRDEFPKAMMSDEKAISLLPAFIRTVRGSEMEETEINKFIKMIKSANTPDGNEFGG